jgi:PAS domain S-box-containing protein
MGVASVILRVFRGDVRFADALALESFVRERAIPSALAIPGLLAFQPAIARSEEGLRLVLVSTWTEFGAILAQGHDLDTPIAMPDAAGIVAGGRGEHYELVFGSGRGLPLTSSTLRITRVPLERGYEASYFELARAHAERLLENADLVAFLLGRRTLEDTTEALVATVWDDVQEEVPSGLLGGAEAAGYHASPPETELLRALSVAPASEHAPAILLADDERRYLHATRAAAELTGHSVAALLSMRVDDLTAPELRDAVPGMWERFLAMGSMSSRFALRRRDGSEVAVRFSARARSPWPGSHASMFVPGESETPPDIDTALVDGGFVSRFVTVPGPTDRD